VLICLLLACLISALVWTPAVASVWLLTIGASLLGLVTILVGIDAGRLILTRYGRTVAVRALQEDPVSGILTDRQGNILSANPAAKDAFHETLSDGLATTLRGVSADATGLVARLLSWADRTTVTRETLDTRAGPLFVTVRQTDAQTLLWRFEPSRDTSTLSQISADLPFPVLQITEKGAVILTNAAAKDVFDPLPDTLTDIAVNGSLDQDTLSWVKTKNGPQPVFIVEQPLPDAEKRLFLIPAGAGRAWPDHLDVLPVAMIRLDRVGNILSTNAPARRLLGPTEAKCLSDVMEGLGRPVQDWIDDAFKSNSASKAEFLRLTRRDREVFVQVTLSPSQPEEKDQLIAILSDATELKTLEAQFVQSQKMQAIGQLAGGVAHDFNNLLTAISGHCDLMLLRHDPGDEDYGDLMQVAQNANRAASLVGQLLAFSRKQTLRPEILDVRDTLADLTHLLNRLVGEKVRLTLTHDPVLGYIRADKRQLEQVLMNLVVNARDAMPGGGEIRIVTEAVSLTAPMERDRVTLPMGKYVSVKVVDQGVGIPGDQLQKVFEPFFTTKRPGEGTGLGLSTAYGIVKQTGGYIFVDSSIDAGTCFTLMFPVRDKPVASPHPEAEPSVPHVPRTGRGVVLLVEDEAPVRAFASRALRLRGFTVIEADCAEAALDRLSDADLHVDIFVTDVVMPGMDGPTWVRTARKSRPEVRVVFVSGYAESAFGETEPTLPNSVFLQKPFSLNQLTEKVFEQMAEGADAV